MTTALLLIPRHVEEERVVKVRDQTGTGYSANDKRGIRPSFF